MINYLDDYRIYASLNGTWTDITTDAVVDPIKSVSGINGNSPDARIAQTGEFSFTLKNFDGKYTPGSTLALSGWDHGTFVKFIITYDGVDFVKFYGKVSKIEPITDTNGYTFAKIACLDWLDYAAKHPVRTPTVQFTKRADEAIETILATMPIQPLSTNISNGINTFPTVFDATSIKTKALSEFSKLNRSEFGYLYLRENGNLVFEGFHDRSGLDIPETIPVATIESSILLTEDGEEILTEDGETIVANETESATVEDEMMDINLGEYGNNVVNRVVAIAYPRKVDTSPAVLYSLGSPMLIGSNETKIFTINYSDPSGGAQVNGFNMITPVDTTDYLLNTAEDGSGTDITASAIVTVTYGASSAEYTIQNGSGYSGYITFLQARGYGIYNYNQTQHEESSDVSVDDRGYINLTIDQTYQKDIGFGTAIANIIIDREKDPHITIESVTMCANSSGHLMSLFINVDVGDMVEINSTKLGLSGYYYIQQKSYEIQIGGTIMFEWVVKEVFSLLMGLSMIAVEFFPGSAIDFGQLKSVQNLPQRSVSVWVYLNKDTPISGNGIITALIDSDYSGMYIATASNNRLKFWVYADGNVGIWFTPNASLTANAWNKITLVRDSSNASNQPTIYINGVEQALTVSQVLSGSIPDESGTHLFAGNMNTATVPYTEPLDGKLMDLRYYNRILTASEDTTLYNGGTVDPFVVTSGLVFQAFAVRTKQLMDYIGNSLLPLTTEHKPIDNIFGYVGTPTGTPAGRLTPTDVPGFSPVAVEFLGGTNGLDFGYVTGVSSLSTRSISFWVYPKTAEYGFLTGLMDYTSGKGSAIIVPSGGVNKNLMFFQYGATSPCNYTTPTNSFIKNNLYHVVVTRDSSSASNAPIIYINGTAQTLTAAAAQVGATLSESGMNFEVGNYYVDGSEYAYGFYGIIKGLQIHNVILTPTEVSQLYAGTAVTRGLVSKPLNAPTASLSSYIDQALTSSLPLYDSVTGDIGYAHGAPVCRAE